MRRSARSWLVAVVTAALIGSAVVATPSAAQAVVETPAVGKVASAPALKVLVGSQFDPGFIISDRIFFDKNAMSEAQIQAWLESKLPTCAQTNGVACLKSYTETTNSRDASPNGNCAAYSGAANERASTIIWRVSQACNINPQVILVTLQKEQGLITKGSPTALEYRKAMGYGCPDTSSCDSRYYGFFNQIYNAAWQFQQYTLFPNRTYKIGPVAVRYAPSAGCEGPVVNIRNQATANLYNYTPYQPNAASLANLTGSNTAACSSYGNRNFWVYFNTWFGTSTGPIDPVGSLEVVAAGPGALRVSGWVYDPNTVDPTQVHIYVNGIGRAFEANGDRPELPGLYGDVGILHGFDVSIPVETAGTQSVCAYGINQGPGQNTLLGCKTVQPMTGSPVGIVDSVTAGLGVVTVTGWALDPDTVESIDVSIYVDNVPQTVTANVSRPDIAAAYPAYGGNHGYSATIPVGPGQHTVCVYGVEKAGTGSTSLRGCKVVAVPTGSPIGIIDSVIASPGAITVRGWALDPDTASSIPLHIYTDSDGLAFTADASRPDIALAYPGYGDAHGYDVTYSAAPGKHTVCVYGIDIAGSGANSLRGCKVVTVPTGSPIGIIDSVTVSGGTVTVTGWALDPDTVDSIPIHIYTGSSGLAFTADVNRPDIAAAYPAYGANHGYSASFTAPPGTHTVCVYGIDIAGTGSNSLRGCRVITVG